MYYIHTTDYYSALKEKKILAHPTKQMNLENVMSSEVSQSQKDMHSMLPLL